MDQQQTPLPEEPGFTVSENGDPFVVGEAMLDRAKSVSQRIANRVRELTQETQTDTADEGTAEHRPLSD